MRTRGFGWDSDAAGETGEDLSWESWRVYWVFCSSGAWVFDVAHRADFAGVMVAMVCGKWRMAISRGKLILWFWVDAWGRCSWR